MARQPVASPDPVTPFPVTFETACLLCCGRATIQFVDHRQGTPPTEARWRCPYCRAERGLGALGSVRWVRKSAPYAERAGRLAGAPGLLEAVGVRELSGVVRSR